MARQVSGREKFSIAETVGAALAAISYFAGPSLSREKDA
jgi:hypothetical protein